MISWLFYPPNPQGFVCLDPLLKQQRCDRVTLDPSLKQPAAQRTQVEDDVMHAHVHTPIT